MNKEILYIELKTGFSHNGPAWIGVVEFSKSKQTVYFDGKALKKFKSPGINANYYDIENGNEYWISGVKKDGLDRHKFGGGKIMLDKNAVEKYLEIIGDELINTKKIEIVNIEKTDRKKFTEIENSKVNNEDRNSYFDNNYNKLNKNHIA